MSQKTKKKLFFYLIGHKCFTLTYKITFSDNYLKCYRVNFLNIWDIA